MAKAKPPSLTAKQQAELLLTLEERFNENMPRHSGMVWKNVEAKLLTAPEKLWSLFEMERTGGEPDVIAAGKASSAKNPGEIVFFDCSEETPKGRRSTCFDREGWESRKEHRPETSAMEMAAAMGIELLTEEQYRLLQTLGEFDLKTSSWVQTPAAIRKLGGALFMDRRYDHVFVYHNGAQSYYAVRGFRACLQV